MKSRIFMTTLMIALAISTTACKKEEGPLEKAGKKMDEAAEKVEDSVKEAADEVEKAVKD